MLASIEQTTSSQVIPTEPTVTFDDMNTINVWVIVSSFSGKLSFKAPPLAINGPQSGRSPWPWTVYWNFVPDSSVGAGVVDHFEVLFPTPPSGPGITLGTPQPNNPNQVQATITFDETLPLTLFNYDVSAVLVKGDRQVVHDPTIVVTPEPIG